TRDVTDFASALGSDAGGITKQGGAGNDSLDGMDGDDQLIGLEGFDTLTGGDGDDTLSGGDQGDVLSGGDGNDQIRSGHGFDTLLGGAGDDVLGDWSGWSLLDGGEGDDILRAGAGQDTLIGGEGDDTLTGGSKADTFAFDTESGSDQITDFALGEDKIDLQDIAIGDGEDETSAADFMSENASIDGQDLVLDLGDGRMIRILDVVDEDIGEDPEDYADIFDML
ncbi:MAG: calcium-binding protein, partial [Pseudomonadota bacterium]